VIDDTTRRKNGMIESEKYPMSTKELVDCAMGRSPADLVIQDGKWVCVQTGEIIEHTDIAIIGDRFAFVGSNASHTIGAKTKIIHADGKFMVPGLLDAHMHVESTMLTVTEFVRAVIPHGTTAIFIDPHEIANVFGLPGVKLMVDEAADQPIHIWVQVPSCIPSNPGFETSGAILGPAEVKEALTWDRIIGLGEVMNFPGVAASDEKMLSEIGLTIEAKKVIGGHYASPDLGLSFHGYVAGGAQDDHEGTSVDDAIQRARQGMKVMMRYGSAWQDVAELSRAVTEFGCDPRNFLLCTDDSHSHTLFNDGHMDRVVRHAISNRLTPMQAIQMATVNTAEYFGVSKEIGMIAPGRSADILLVSDLTEFSVEMVIIRGKTISQAGHILIDIPEYCYPEWAVQSIKIKNLITADDFRITTNHSDKVTINTIGIIENQAPTRHLQFDLPVENGEIKADINRDLVKVALVERHQGKGVVQKGFVSGFGFQIPCAVATTVAHDCHQMIVVGTDDECMALAANTLVKCGGGQVAIANCEICGLVELPIAGIMSNESGQTVARKAANVLAGFKECGCKLNNPNMQLSLLALVVIPEIRISDLGLVDTTQMKMIDLIER
jgi:adenine deaminase